MTAFEYLQSEVQRLGGLAGEYERLYLRAKEASRGHQVGLERALRKVARLESELALERAISASKIGRLKTENDSLTNKVARLSLKLIQSWG